MSAVRGGVGTRLFVVGGQDVRSEFSRTADSAKRMWSEIGSGQREANPALRVLSGVAGEARDRLEGMAGAAGGLGLSLTAAGAAGVAAGAAIGGLILAIQNSAVVAEWADDLATAADLIGVSAESLQELRYAGEVFEVSATDMDTALRKLNGTLGAMRTGVGDERLKEAFEELGITNEQLMSLESADQLLPLLADKFAVLGSRADQTQLAKKLQIEELLPLLVQGSTKIEEMTVQARDLGLVMDEASVQGAAGLNEELRVADERLAAAARSAQVELIPALVAIKRYAAEAAVATAGLVGWMNDVIAKAPSVGVLSVIRGDQYRKPKGRLMGADRQAQLDRIAEEAFAAEESGGGGGGGGSPRAATPRQISVTAIDAALPIDPVTRRPIQPRSLLDQEIERLYGPEVKDGVRLPVRVDLQPSLQENLAAFSADFESRTRDAFADGLHAAINGDFGRFLASRLQDMLVEGLASSLALALSDAKSPDKGGGIGGWFVNAAMSVFDRRAVGGDVRAGRAYSLAEYGPEVAVFGRDGQVFDTAATARMMADAVGQASGARMAGGPAPVIINIDAKDAVLTEAVRGWVADGVAQGMREAVEAAGHEAGPRAFDWMSRNRILREP